MEPSVKISCNIATSDKTVPLGLEIWVDDQCVFDQNHVAENIEFNHSLSDADAEHELRFVMKHKTSAHTQVDQNGNIVKDACLTVTDLCFDEIQLGHVFTELAVYEHDFNGTAEPIKEKFFTDMGCNGTVTLKFSTPIYLWLLENL